MWTDDLRTWVECSRPERMNRVKLSVSVSAPLARFVEEYLREHGLGSKSRVAKRALEVLREQELERAYAEASREVDPAWEATAADGLSPEAR